MFYEDETNTRKSFQADDGAGAGTLETVHEWWTSLLAPGPKYGYFPNASKTILLVKSEHYEPIAILSHVSNTLIRMYKGLLLHPNKYGNHLKRQSETSL